MERYPAFFDLRDKRCLVIGAGDVGRRKLETLLEAEPKSVLVMDIAPPTEDMQDLLSNPNVTYKIGTPTEADVQGAFMAFIATSDHTANMNALELCRKHGVLCNCAEAPNEGDFIVPAAIERDGLTLAVSTGGGSPALARKIRQDLEHLIDNQYGSLLQFMRRLRPMVLELGLSSDENSACFRAMVNSGLQDALSEGNREHAEKIVRAGLPASLRDQSGYIEELLDGLV